MEKIQKSQQFENSSIINQDMPNNNEAMRQQLHQHGPAPQYYPLMHQHPQMYNKNHSHPNQSPLLLNINNQQMMHTTTHRHFQHYPPYGVNTNVHQHINNQVRINPASQPAPPSNNHQEEPLKQEPINKDTQLKNQVQKSKLKEGEKKQLRSPSARRPPNAPVTMQGWLHKQGSEGLMLWKKRWFVLSEFCLFYYKGQYLKVKLLQFHKFVTIQGFRKKRFWAQYCFPLIKYQYVPLKIKSTENLRLNVNTPT